MDYLSKEANEISDLVTGGVGVIASAVKNTLVTTMKEITEWPIIRVIYINDQEGSENGIQLWGSEELSKKRRIETHFPNLILLADGLYAFMVDAGGVLRLADTHINNGYTGSGIINTSTWYHVVGVFSGTTGQAITTDPWREYPHSD